MQYLNGIKIESKKSILQFVPQKLNYLTNSDKIIYKDKILKTAYLIDIIHRFITRRFFTNKIVINLSSEIMRKCYGTHYNYYINYLKDNDILKRKSSYLVGQKCNSYSLNTEYINDKLIRWDNNDKILLKKWKKNIISFEVISLNETRKINESVKKKLVEDLFHVEVDFKAASSLLLNMFTDGEIDDIGYWKNQLSIESINDGSLFYVEDDYGRFHTNYTVLKKIIRDEHITIEGKPVEELDIKNSQPLFLSILLKDSKFNIVHPKEYKRYYDSVKNGLIYEEYMNVSGWDRKECKDAMYKVLFANNTMQGKNAKINRFFKKLYPNVWEWLRNTKEKAGTHKVISHELQRRESNLIFDHICHKIHKKIPEARLFTVHDSIFFPKEYHDSISDIFYNHIDTLFG